MPNNYDIKAPLNRYVLLSGGPSGSVHKLLAMPVAILASSIRNCVFAACYPTNSPASLELELPVVAISIHTYHHSRKHNTSTYKTCKITVQVKPLMDSLEGARKAKADADASLKVSNDLVAAVEAKLQQLQDKFMEAS